MCVRAGGLVEDTSMVMLPRVTPLVTVVLTVLAMLPLLKSLWTTPHWCLTRMLTELGSH